MHMTVLSAWKYVMCVTLTLQRLEEGVESPRTGVTDFCESPHGC